MKFISVLLKENTKINICCFLLDFNFNIVEKNYNFVNNFNQTLIYIYIETSAAIVRYNKSAIGRFHYINN